MKRLALAFVVLLIATTWLLVENRPAVEAREVKVNGHGFTLPEGFEIELVAGPPLVNRPITADFDEQGQLYVTDSSGSNDKVEEQLKQRPHRVVRLEDTKGDGKFDKAVVFADKMMFPEGSMWLDGSLYVSAPPSIWKLTDTNGDGVADERVEWFKGKTLTGCANDLHGPYLGPDGWIYWCKGAFAKQTYERPGKKPLVTRASHIFRCRPDGSGIESVMTGGMDNPVDVVFTPGGERIFTTTFFQHPGGGKRDGLIHAVYGGLYGKDHDVIYDHPWTSPDLMPVLTHMGPAAPCGLTRYESDAFGKEYKDNLFACQFNMHKVSRHVLIPDGATFNALNWDFLDSDNLDFHPTEVLEDADGSLLVIDTGGWYKLCCPTSQLHKPDVLGGIYRIRRKGAPKVDDPRGLQLPWGKLSSENLAGLLADSRPAVRRRAVKCLAKRHAEAVPFLSKILSERSSLEGKLNAVWTATRIDSQDARALVRSVLKQPEEELRQAALHSISLWRDREALPELLKLIVGPSLANRRAAAEALGRIGDKSAVPTLLLAAAEIADRSVLHSITYALIEIGDREGTAAGLTSEFKHFMQARRIVLTALDQMEDGRLTADKVAPELTSANAEMRRTAAWIVGRHPEWGGALAGFLRDRLSTKALSAAERDELTGQLARFARAPAVQELLAERLHDAAAPRHVRQVALEAMARAGLKETPSAWLTEVTHALTGKDPELASVAVATARVFPVTKKPSQELVKALLQIGADEKSNVNLRLAALAAVPGGLRDVPAALFDLLLAHLDREQPVAIRSLAVDVLTRAKLSSEQLLALAARLESVGPMELERLLEPFAQSTDEMVGVALLAALKKAEARSSLRVDAVKQRLAKYPTPVQKQAEELYSLLDVDREKQRAKLEELLASTKDGDVRRGQAVFHSTKAACFSCHAVGYRGGTVGPDLTRIGAIRTERDLLESIVFPSASFVRGYEPVLVATKDGKSHNGLLRKDTPEEIVLVIAADKEERIARADIEAIEPSKVSVMPAGLDQQLTVRELADLVAFLKACK
jgi:putative membrane-bound dehydrogenase-like protein